MTSTTFVDNTGSIDASWLNDVNTITYGPSVNIRLFGAVVDNVTDDYVAIKAANDYLVSIGGGELLFDGMSYCSTGIEIAPNNSGENLGITWRGTGWNSGIRASSDIEQIYYGDATTTTTGVSRLSFVNMRIERDTATVYTKVNVSLSVAADVVFDKVFILNNETVSTNIGGISFISSSGTSYPGSVNVVKDSRIQGGGIRLACRDSRVNNTWVWGQRTSYSVYSEGQANTFTDVSGLSSPVNGSFYFSPLAIGNRMLGCTVDGSAATGSGHGIIADSSFGLQIIGCDIYTVADGHAVYFKDMLRGIVTGNNFKDNNVGDNSYDDVRIESIAIASNGNIFQANNHTMQARTNKGYAYNEVNGGTSPGPQAIIDNEIDGATGYQATAINRVNTSTQIRGNRGQNTHARREGQVTMGAGANPTISISHTSPYDPPITDMRVTPSNNAEGQGITSWYISRSSATVVTLFARGTVTSGATFEWQVDSL